MLSGRTDENKIGRMWQIIKKAKKWLLAPVLLLVLAAVSLIACPQEAEARGSKAKLENIYLCKRGCSGHYFEGNLDDMTINVVEGTHTIHLKNVTR